MSLLNLLQSSGKGTVFMLHQFQPESQFLKLLRLDDAEGLSICVGAGAHLHGNFSGLELSPDQIRKVSYDPRTGFPTENVDKWGVIVKVGIPEIMKYAGSRGYEWQMKEGALIGSETFGSDELQFRFSVNGHTH